MTSRFLWLLGVVTVAVGTGTLVVCISTVTNAAFLPGLEDEEQNPQ